MSGVLRSGENGGPRHRGSNYAPQKKRGKTAGAGGQVQKPLSQQAPIAAIEGAAAEVPEPQRVHAQNRDDSAQSSANVTAEPMETETLEDENGETH